MRTTQMRHAFRARTWVGALLRDPRALMPREHPRAQEAILLAAARQLYGSAVDPGAWRHALEELDDGSLVEPAGAPTPGTSHRLTLGKWLYAAIRVTRPEVVIETGVA